VAAGVREDPNGGGEPCQDGAREGPGFQAPSSAQGLYRFLRATRPQQQLPGLPSTAWHSVLHPGLSSLANIPFRATHSSTRHRPEFLIERDAQDAVRGFSGIRGKPEKRMRDDFFVNRISKNHEAVKENSISSCNAISSFLHFSRGRLQICARFVL